MELRNRKGMTLTEVIIALMIISVIIVGVLSYVSSGYTNIMRLRGTNVENFAIQEYFEEEMAKAKRETGNGTETLGFSYSIGGGPKQTINVKGKTLAYDKTSRQIYLFVANQKEVTLEIPDDVTAKIENAKPYYYLGETIPAGSVELPVDNIGGVTIKATGSWLLSNRALGGTDLVTVANLVPDSETSAPSPVRMPRMTDDFKDLNATTYSERGFRVTRKMLGKYLTFGGRAVNTYGRVGSFQPADERIWLMGLPVVDNLREHMDADLLTNNGATIKDATVMQFHNHFKRTVYSQNMTVRSVPLKAKEDGAAVQPRQVVDLGNTNPLQFLNNDLSKGHTLSLLVTDEEQAGDLLRYQINDSLSWTLSLGKYEDSGEDILEISFIDNTPLNSIMSTEKTVLENDDKIDYSRDNAIQVRSSVSENGDTLTLEVSLNGTVVSTSKLILTGQRDTTRYSRDATKAVIFVGGNTHINEMALYHKALSDDELTQVSDYFNGKYDTTYNAEQP